MNLRQPTHVIRLPIELICAIVDFAASSFPIDVYDPQTHREYTTNEAASKRCFTSFSLVSRLWHSLAVRYLNQTLAITISSLPEAHLRVTNLADVLQWLDAHPTPTDMVERFRLIAAPDLYDWDELVPDTGFKPDQLFRILHRFPKIRSVELVNIRFDDEEVDDFEADESSLLNLDRFAVYHASACSPIESETLQFLSWIGEVDEVYIYTDVLRDWTLGYGNAAGDLTVPKYMRTPSLVIKSMDIPRSFMRHFHGAQTFTEGILKTLYVQIDMYTIPNLSTLLAPATHSVVDLTFDFVLFLARTTQPCKSSLRPISNYRSLMQH